MLLPEKTSDLIPVYAGTCDDVEAHDMIQTLFKTHSLFIQEVRKNGSFHFSLVVKRTENS